MTCILGIPLAPFRIPKERRLQTIGAIHYIFVLLVMPLLCTILAAYLLLYTRYWWLMVLYFVWMYVDVKTPEKGGRPWKALQHARIWNWLRDYFPISLGHIHSIPVPFNVIVKTCDLFPERNYIFGYHPHGLIGVSRKSIEHVLAKGNGGNAIAIVIGGADEALDAHPGCTPQLLLSRRKGFVRLALRCGADLVPVYSFGENDLYRQVQNPEGSRLRQFQVALKKLAGFSPPIFHGRGIFNYSFGWLPYRRPITTIVGSPIRVEKTDNPTEEQVNELHLKYSNALTDLFEAHKSKYAIPENIHLKFR